MKSPNPEIEYLRIEGPAGSNNGVFRIEIENAGMFLVIASDGFGWDHVSVSNLKSIPIWVVMEKIKRIFFDESEVVMQLHVAEKDHINRHPNCLHLWRPQTTYEIKRIRQEWGSEWCFGDIESPGTIPLPPKKIV